MKTAYFLLFACALACNLYDDTKKRRQSQVDLCSGEVCKSTLECTGLLTCDAPDPDYPKDTVCLFPTWLKRGLIVCGLMSVAFFCGVVSLVWERVQNYKHRKEYRRKVEQANSKLIDPMETTCFSGEAMDTPYRTIY